jgi:D(-)-tartrate dehydratase
MQDEKRARHGERCGAVGLIDVAIWNLAAKACGEPLWRTFARDGLPHASGRIATCASGRRCRSENDIALSCDEVRRATDRGHRRFKIKIGGAKVVQHLRRSEALLTILEPGMMLAIDGNGTFSRDVARSYLHQRSAWRGERCQQGRTIQ